MTQAALDHLVINTHYDIDAAQAQLQALGFIVTPRGTHTLGSVNHLVVLTGGYLELIGQPREGKVVRQEILDSPLGIDGLVYAVDDAQHRHDAWRAQGLQAQPVQFFSRPVDLDGQAHDARFSTVRLVAGQFAAGRVYACHHFTPELVWRPQWMAHPNGVQGIASLLVVSADPRQAAVDYARLGQLGAGFALEFTDLAGLAGRFGALARHAPSRSEFFAAIRFVGGDVKAIAAHARQQGLPLLEEPQRVVLALPQFQSLLEFSA